MTTLIAFLVALGLLIAVHEYGHYRMALACGVKVLRFSIGFGKPLLTWRRPGSSTEFTIGLLPLGGYVRMLDEREGPVAVADRHLAFNIQPLRSRALIVAAGPAANLLLAILLYALVNWMGVQEPKPVLSSPTVGSLAEQAGLRGGEWVSQVATAGEEPEAVASFEDLRWRLTQAALAGQDLTLWVAKDEATTGQPVVLPLTGLDVREADAQLFNRIGIVFPWSSPQIGEVMGSGAGAAAGLLAGDLVLRVDGRAIVDAQQLRALIRSAIGPDGRVVPQQWALLREGRLVDKTVQPIAEQVGDAQVARIGAYVGAPPAMVLVRHGWLDGVSRAVVRTWEVSWLTLKMMGRMLIGEASIKNLSGPLTIADYAGKSASIGVTSYLLFLALISVSLGVLNLLPLPVLDGGHLMYYLWEGVTGRSVSDAWMERLQRGGAAILMALMAVALFNDLARFAS